MKTRYIIAISVTLLMVVVYLILQNRTAYYIVRHAEKSGDTLTEDGQNRAAALRDSLIGKNIKNVWVSTTNRSQQTAAPLVEALVAEGSFDKAEQYHIYGYSESDEGASFMTSLKANKGNMLIVGHTNNINGIIDSLIHKDDEIDINPDDYDNMFVVVMWPILNINQLFYTSYGEESP